MSKDGDLPKLVRRVKRYKAKLVIVDTQDAAFPGIDENSAGPEGQGRVWQVAQALAKAGAALLLVGHPADRGAYPARREDNS